MSGQSRAGGGLIDCGPPSSGTATASFHARRISAHTAVVTVLGEVDVLSANSFRDFLTYHVTPGQSLVLDLSGVEFMGTSGLSVLSVLSTRSRTVGGSLTLINSRAVQRLLKAAGQQSMFVCCESVENAVGLEEYRRFLT